MKAPRTVWRIRGLGYPNPPRHGLDVEVVADTTAPEVVRAIEHAAARAGVALERVEPDEQETPA